MKPHPFMLGLVIVVGVAGNAATTLADTYPWLDHPTSGRTIASAIAPPTGFARTPQTPGSFGAWLRGLPLLEDGSPVRLHNRQPKAFQRGHVAVVDLNVLTPDQHCADSILRLRAEWLWSTGQTARLTRDAGLGVVTWRGGPRTALVQFLSQVFAKTGTYNLAGRLAKKRAPLDAGDVLVQGGSPGHAMLVVDVAVNPQGERVVLLANGFMPAQQFHIVKNLWGFAGGTGDVAPWYRETDLDTRGLETPLWGAAGSGSQPFTRRDVRTFEG